MSRAHAMLSTLGNLYDVVTRSRIGEVVFHFDRVSSEYAASTDTAVWLGGINPRMEGNYSLPVSTMHESINRFASLGS